MAPATGNSKPAETKPAEVLVSEEQRTYAIWLERGMRLGFGLLVLTFLLYVTGIVKPHVDLQELPRLWGLSAADFRQAADTPAGWGWLRFAGTGDYMNFFGVVLLAFVTVPCYLRVLPIFHAARERVFVAIVILEVIVLSLAASGLLVLGGH
jgi:hypothetical protein